MKKISYSEYWKQINSNSYIKTNKVFNIGLRILTFVVLVITLLCSKYLFNNDLLENIIVGFITLLLWIIIWISIFVWNKSREPLLLYNQLIEKINELDKNYSTNNSLIVSHPQPIVRGNAVFEKISITSKSQQDLYSCFVLIDDLFIVNGKEENKVDVVSRNISWSDTGRRTVENKVDLIIGIPEELNIVRVDNDNRFSLIGEKGNDTPLNNGLTYRLKLRISGMNLLPHIFEICFKCHDNGTVDLLRITNPSFLLFFNSPIGIPPFLFKPEVQRKKK